MGVELIGQQHNLWNWNQSVKQEPETKKSRRRMYWDSLKDLREFSISIYPDCLSVQFEDCWSAKGKIGEQRLVSVNRPRKGTCERCPDWNRNRFSLFLTKQFHRNRLIHEINFELNE